MSSHQGCVVILTQSVFCMSGQFITGLPSKEKNTHTFITNGKLHAGRSGSGITHDLLGVRRQSLQQHQCVDTDTAVAFVNNGFSVEKHPFLHWRKPGSQHFQEEPVCQAVLGPDFSLFSWLIVHHKHNMWDCLLSYSCSGLK